MLHNVGKIDRYIRLATALTIFILYYLEVISGDLGEGLLIAAVVLFVTSLRRCCPVYGLLGFGTCSAEPNGKEAPKIKTKKLKL
ncbi:MAG: YgaP family membrane protein [Bacteroidota bacterium]